MNKAAVAAFAAKGAAVIEDLHGGKIIIGGQEYDATVGSVPLEGQLSPGGEILEGELLVLVRKVLLPVPPPRRTRVQARGRNFVVLRDPEVREVEPVWTLHLGPTN